MPFEPIARVANISTGEADVASRLFIWKNMLGQISEHPILGVGAEHIDVLFNKFYDPTKIQEEWFDRSHNAFLDYAAQYGVGGLLLYLALIGSFFLAARRLRAQGERRTAGLLALLAIAYAAQNFFVFDTISSFWLFLALLAAACAVRAPEVTPEPLGMPRVAPYLSWAAALVLIALIWPVSVRPAVAAYDIAHAYAYALVAPEKANAYLSNGFSLRTYGNLEYGYQVYDMYADHQATALTGAARVEAYKSTEAILAADFNRYPYDARAALYYAHVLSLAPPGISVDKDVLSVALTRAIKGSPKRYQAWYVLVNLSIGEANTHPIGSKERAAGYAAAIDLLKSYEALVPDLAQPYFVHAQLLYAIGDTAGAAAEAAKGKAVYRSDRKTAERAAAYYETVRDWENAAFFLRDIITNASGDDASRYELAKVSYLAGDYATAEEIVAALRESNPDILATDPSFMSAFTAYEQSHR